MISLGLTKFLKYCSTYCWRLLLFLLSFVWTWFRRMNVNRSFHQIFKLLWQMYQALFFYNHDCLLLFLNLISCWWFVNLFGHFFVRIDKVYIKKLISSSSLWWQWRLFIRKEIFSPILIILCLSVKKALTCIWVYNRFDRMLLLSQDQKISFK